MFYFPLKMCAIISTEKRKRRKGEFRAAETLQENHFVKDTKEAGVCRGERQRRKLVKEPFLGWRSLDSQHILVSVRERERDSLNEKNVKREGRNLTLTSTS